MSDKEQQRRERAYKIWEEEGRQDGAHDDHWARAGRQEDLDDQQSEDVIKANQEADEKFATEGKENGSSADIRPPSSVAPD